MPDDYTQQQQPDLLALLLKKFDDIHSALAATKPVGELLTADEASAYVGLSRSALYRLVSEGRIQQVHVPGTHPKFRKKDLDKWLTSLKPIQ